MKKNKYSKFALLSLIFPAYVSISLVANESLNNNSSTTETNQVSTDLNDSVTANSSAYNHTNYFSFPNEKLPANINSYDIYAQTNLSMLTQTTKGVLSLTTNKTTIMFTSYSGQVIWVQGLSTNALLQTFCTNNSMNSANLKVQQWVYLSNNSSRNWAAFLITDNTKQAIITIDLDTGLFVPDNVDSNLFLNGDQVFKKISDSSDTYNGLFQIGSDTLVAFKSGSNQAPLLIKYDYTGKSISTTTLTLNYTNSNTREIASFIYIGVKTYALTIDKIGINDDSKTKFNQYLAEVSLDSNNKLTVWNEKQLSNSYIVDGTETTLTNIDNFKNVFFYKKTNNVTNFYLLSGSIGNNYIEVCKYDGTNLTIGSSVSLSGYTINSITYSSNFNKIYIANNKTSDTVYLSYIDLSSNSLKLSPIQQSTDNKEKKYFLIPILETTNKEYLIQYSGNSSTAPIYMIYSNSSYSNVGKSMTYATWWFLGADISTRIGVGYTPDGVTLSLIKTFIDITAMNGNATEGKRVANYDNGTLQYTLNVAYSTVYDSTINSSFNLTFYITGLAKSSAYSFNWIDANSTGTDETEKAKKIADLKANNYPNNISKTDILNNFFNYKILNSSGTQASITESMITTSYSVENGTLTVSLNLSSLNLPNGTNTNKINFSKQYSGFLSTSKYTASKKSNTDISNFSKTIYPSELTTQQIVTNFLTTSGLTNDLSNWNITISNPDDFKGTVTISASYIGAQSQVTSANQLPTSYFNKFNNIINNQAYGGFKSISSNTSLTSKPTIKDLTSTTDQNSYLPSEIWNQYLEYMSGTSSINKNDVILLKNLSSTLTDIDNLVIDTKTAEVVDTASTTGDYSVGYIKFNVTLKNGISTDVNYNGTQYESKDNKLVVNDNLQSKIGYPYTITWNINTYNKFFVLKDKDGNSLNSDSPNVYEVDLNSDTNTFSNINNNIYSSQLTTDDISSLIDAKGYNYNITLDSNLNKGYVKATINLTLQDKPLSGNDLTNNPNFTKTIYIYNFKIPMSESATLMILAAICFASSAVLIIIISQASWLTKKIKYKVLLKNSRDLEVRQRKLENLSRKKRYFKD